MEEGLLPFKIKDCSLIELSSKKMVQDLRELRDVLMSIPLNSIYHHFYGNLLKPSFELQVFTNDFAQWVKDALHEDVLAEKLGVLDPSHYEDLEQLRADLIDVIEEHLYEKEYLPLAKSNQLFHFMHSYIVIFDTDKTITKPEDLPQAVDGMSLGSIFYHFIDARRRTEDRMDDFSSWLKPAKRYYSLINRIRSIDPFFRELSETKRQLYNVVSEYFKGVQ